MFKKKKKANLSDLDILKNELSLAEIKADLACMDLDELRQLKRLEKHLNILISCANLSENQEVDFSFKNIPDNSLYSFKYNGQLSINKIEVIQ